MIRPGDAETAVGDDEGPALERMASETVEALAAVDDARLREYAEEELLDEFEVERVTALRDLARTAIRLNQGMYCWMCP
ncbi:hypothetical protein [Microbispora sp. H10830]|uniref:hypothetical protein n=1 Tax=Microbispora sp. H10830 TaxID=2729109 RepID=UPI00160481FA|nr:hypothetical protein [Microbispora sp. H10830]